MVVGYIGNFGISVLWYVVVEFENDGGYVLIFFYDGVIVFVKEIILSCSYVI